MARNVQYFIDPEEEERKRLAIEEAFGPPAPPPNLGTMSRQQISAADIEAAQAAAMRPTPVTDTQFVEEEEEPAEEAPSELSLLEQEFAPLPAGPIDAVQPGVLRQNLPLSEEERIRQGLPRTLGNPAIDENPFAELEEELLPPEEPPPAAVDKTAASVAQEQKGVPAAPPPIGARTDARIAKMDEELPARARDYGNQAERMTAPAEYQKGERSDLLGFDDEEGFLRQKRIQRVQELYGEESAPDSHWEDEFLRERGNSSRLTDDQIRRRGAVIGFLGGAFEGDSSSGSRWADQQHRANSSFEEGRARARDRDQGNRRISRGMAEAIAATGQVSPEAAVQLRMNDSLVKNFGQYASAGVRAEGQGIGLSKTKLNIMGNRVEGDIADERTREVAKLNATAQTDAAQARGQFNVLPTEQQIAAAGALVEQTLGIKGKPGIGVRALRGELREGEMTPEQQGLAARVVPQFIAKMSSKNGLDQILNESLKVQANQAIKDEFSIAKSVDMARADPKYRTKFKTDWNVARDDFSAAWSGWQELSPEGKEALAQWAAGGWTGKIRAFLMKPGDQQRVARVQGVINALVKDRSGAAVTGSEWERIATEIGIEHDNWNPWNSPTAIEDFLKRTGGRLKTHRDVFDQEIGWETPHVR